MSRPLSIALLIVISTPGCDSPAEMQPGHPCGSCHGDHAPAFGAAGTLYADPWADRGDGLEGARVLITDAHGKVVTVRSNQAGNFFIRDRLVPPLEVSVTSGDLQVSMEKAPHGDCNACHAGDADGPGRIHLP